MNTEAMTELADFIENVEPEAFTMECYWEADKATICGTAGCLAGWQSHIGIYAEQTLMAEKLGHLPNYFKDAQYDLRLTDWEADMLFTNSAWWASQFVNLDLHDEAWHRKYIGGEGFNPLFDHPFGLGSITTKEAVLVLRALVDGTIKF